MNRRPKNKPAEPPSVAQEATADVLRLDPHNVNTHSDASLQAVQLSVARLGAGRSIVVDADDTVVAGEATLRGARQLGLPIRVVETDGSELVVVKRRDLKTGDPRRRALAIADNQTAKLSDFDEEKLIEQLRSLGDSQDLLTATGFSDQDLIDLLAPDIQPDPADAPAQTDRAAELRERWQTEPGQLWLLGGKHRLLVGDSTKPEDAARVMGGEKAMLLATDPPYGVDFAGAKYNPSAKEWAGIENDELQGGDLEAFVSAMLAAWIPHIDEQAGFYFWTAAMQEGAAAAAAVRKAGLHIQSQIIWNKNCLVLGQTDYHWKHENCWYAFWKGKKHRWYGERTQTTVWDVSKIANSSYVHPMQKPVELYAIPMQNHTKQGEAVAEPFAGSGTQFIAAENLGRRCFGIEVSPEYCAVVLDRYHTAFPAQEIRQADKD